MLTATFSLFRGLSESAEGRLWQSGVFSWDQFMLHGDECFSPQKTAAVRDQIPEAHAALSAGLADWFINRLKGAARARIYPHFRDGIRFLDIETTGLGQNDPITTIAVYDGFQLRVFIEGVNLHEFPQALKGAALLVTFNGSRFDLPRLRRRFNIDLAYPHLDLLPVVKSLGYHGGLKACEVKMRLRRQVKEDLNGADAVQLWNRYSCHGDCDALRLLTAYNCQDVLSLESILVKIYNQEMGAYPLFKRMVPTNEPDVWGPFLQLFDN